MKTYTFLKSKPFLLGLLLCTISGTINAQEKIVTRVPADTSKTSLNMDAVYNRPFLALKNTPVA